MNFSIARFSRRGLAAAACVLGLVVPLAQAGPLANFSFEGQGNLLVFDTTTGSGGWNGEIREFSNPASPLPVPLSFAVLVTFDFDAATNHLLGSFEFTQTDDLDSSIFGRVTGGFTDPAGSLATGGQLGLDYSVLGGTGRYAGYGGFALSFLEFDPSAGGDNYAEQGLIVAMPEPGMAWLVMTAGLLLVQARQRRQQELKRQGRSPRLP
jgi:hypothetical protein